MSYSQKLRDPRWQKKRLHILERDDWSCLICKSTTKNLQVHHVTYIKEDPWNYPDDHYQTLCDECHQFRQYIIDNAANAFKLALKDLPNTELEFAAQRMFDMCMNKGGVK
jgi:5-methylcytosine-specific restriction endonuclease McrA